MKIGGAIEILIKKCLPQEFFQLKKKNVSVDFSIIFLCGFSNGYCI